MITSTTTSFDDEHEHEHEHDHEDEEDWKLTGREPSPKCPNRSERLTKALWMDFL
jgi:hypothetical protein